MFPQSKIIMNLNQTPPPEVDRKMICPKKKKANGRWGRKFQGRNTALGNEKWRKKRIKLEKDGAQKDSCEKKESKNDLFRH